MAGKTMEKIAAAVARQYGASADDMRGHDKSRRSAWPRHEAMLVMSEAGFARAQIGAFFNSRSANVVTNSLKVARMKRAARAGK